MRVQDSGRKSEQNMDACCAASRNDRIRAMNYQLFSRILLAPVDSSLLKALESVDFRASAEDVRVVEGCALVDSYLESNGLGPATLDELAADYHFLISVDAQRGSRQVSPFETVNFAIDEDDADDLLDDVYATFTEEGVLLSPDWAAHPDHVSAELELMGILARRASGYRGRRDETELTACLEAQRTFFAGHVGNWVPSLAASLEEQARTSFYRGAALCLSGFLSLEARHLGFDDSRSLREGISA